MALRVYEHACQSCAVEDLVAMTQEKASPTGLLRLGMAQGVGDLVLAEAANRLQTDLPKLDLRLRTDWSAGLFQQVHEGTLDAAIILLPSSSKLPPAERAFHRLPSNGDRSGGAASSVSATNPARAACQGGLGAQSCWLRLPSGFGGRYGRAGRGVAYCD
jgi:DNA-binding transcriptional LysR family regulator